MAFHEHFEIDSVTGFLTPKPSARIKNGFTSQQKVEWLDQYRQCANFTKSAKAIGVAVDTVRDHINGDDKFKQAYKLMQTEFNNNVEESLYLAAVKSKNVTAMFGWLRANYPAKYREGYTDKGPIKSERLDNLLNTLKDEIKKDGKKDR